MNKTFVMLLAIFCIAILFRFWKLEERTLFSGEATAELVILRNLATGKQSPLLGYAFAPYVEGGLYTTPWVWYLLVPLWMISNGNPEPFLFLHPLTGLVSIYFLYRAGALLYSKKAGLLAAALYASTMAIVNIDRSIWSPSFIPPLVNVALYVYAKLYRSPTKKTALLLGAVLGLLASLHIVTLAISSIGLGLVLWKQRKMVLFVLIPLVLSFIPLLLYDAMHEFQLATTFPKALSGMADGTRTYSSTYLLYQFYSPILLVCAVVLTKLHNAIGVVLVGLFMVWQFQQFLAYDIHPNYQKRKSMMQQLLTFWEREQTIEIYMNDKPFFEYGYLFLYLGRNEGVTEDSITVLTPSPQDKERAFQLIRERAIDITLISPESVKTALENKKGVLVLDDEKLKLLSYSSLNIEQQ